MSIYQTNHYYADLHIHSHFSRATSPDCNLEILAAWAQIKGISLCATGDCTHPEWLDTLQTKLIPSAPGLYSLREKQVNPLITMSSAQTLDSVKFMITGEISSIYKRDGRVRKVHSLIWLPSIEAAIRLKQRLDPLYNIRSDGRPILGVDPRNLIEILLEVDQEAVLIPAHIWTPWFSMLGARSGFDSVEECFGEFTNEIFAVETGLSSDAPMNHSIRMLDNLALLSNSDLHSPGNLGRNANIFFGEPAYSEIVKGLKQKNPAICGGTVDLFPEEGKYFLDGHRNCKQCLTPAESMARDNLCPTCGKLLTMGVLHRVYELEQQQGCDTTTAPPTRLPYCYTIPLPELLSQINGVGVNSKRVTQAYMQLIHQVGPELPFLLDTPVSELESHGLLGQAIMDIRREKVIKSPGYDGVYGSVIPESISKADQ